MTTAENLERTNRDNAPALPVDVRGLAASLVIWATVGLGVCSFVGV